MVNPVALHNKTHRNTRVITIRSAEFGENIHFVPVLGDELRHLVLDYPVCFMKDPETGQFGLFALMGFEPGQNLYLQGERWNATYVPLHIRRQPFMVARPPEGSSGKAVISLDMDSPRVQELSGEALFNEDGSNTPYLDQVIQIMSALIAGTDSTSAFVDTVAGLDLIEATQLDITFADGEKKRFEGLYTISAEKMRELSGDDLEQLHKRGFLEACTLITASMGQVQHLIDLRNARS